MIIKSTYSQTINNSSNGSFAKILKEILNGPVRQRYPEVVSLASEQGFFTSGQYGSYRVGLYTKNKRMAGYLICDVLMGEYKLFNGDYRLTNKI